MKRITLYDLLSVHKPSTSSCSIIIIMLMSLYEYNLQTRRDLNPFIAASFQKNRNSKVIVPAMMVIIIIIIRMCDVHGRKTPILLRICCIKIYGIILILLLPFYHIYIDSNIIYYYNIL